MWVLLLSRRSDPPGSYVQRRELESGDLSVGRRQGLCDWVIDDETGWVSRQHARFTVKGLDLYVTDLSLNGIALNTESNRIAPKIPVQIRVGDKLLLNTIVIEVASPYGGVGERSMSELRPPPSEAEQKLDQPDLWFNGSAPWQDPAAPPRGGHDFLGAPASASASTPSLPGGTPPPFFSQSHEFLAPAGALTAPPPPPPPIYSSPLDEAFRRPILAPIEPAQNMFDIPADWQTGGRAQPDPFDPAPAAPPTPPPPSAPMAGLERAPAAPPAADPSSDLAAAWRAFCEGAEIAPDDLDPPSLDSMRRLGAFYRQTVLGLADLMSDRASFKDEFRVARTQLGAGRNNPIKLLPPFEAGKMMLKAPLGGYLGAEETVREGLEDVKRHQLAMLAGVQHALRTLFERLSPEAVEAGVKALDARDGPKWLRRGADPWTIYQTMFQSLKQEAGSSASSVMSVAFRDGYESFLRRN
ncbi:MAG TPA: type VI secretion system-associated FHA domain protein TagH [Allosphingosinicella sp.]|jgi:type VI secretion system FHA domain protein